MDNLNMDSHDSGEESFFSRIMENQKIRLGAALALGLIVGSGATWATMKTDPPKKSRAVVEQRRVENRVKPVQSNETASKRPATTKKVSLKVALKDCNKITNKNKRAACITRTKKAYAKRTNSTTRRTTTSTKPATTTTRSATSTKPATRSAVKPVIVESNNNRQIASASPMRVPE